MWGIVVACVLAAVNGAHDASPVEADVPYIQCQACEQLVINAHRSAIH